MSTQTTKIAHYLRATSGAAPFNLQSLIKRARKAFPTVGSSEIKLHSEEVIRIQHYKSEGPSEFIHLARYVPGEQASTLLPHAPTAEDDEDTEAPPRGREFKDGDCFLVVRNHDLVFCSHGISHQKARSYFIHLFKGAGVPKDDRVFELSPATNLDKLKLLQEHGVRAIQLSSNAFSVSLPKKQRSTFLEKVLGAFADEISALVEKDDSVATQKAMEDLLVNVEVRLDGNTRADISAQEVIEFVGENVLDDDESVGEFVITTQTGEKIKSGEIKLNKPFKAEKQGRSVAHHSIWHGLSEYFEELTDSNLLEE